MIVAPATVVAIALPPEMVADRTRGKSSKARLSRESTQIDKAASPTKEKRTAIGIKNRLSRIRLIAVRMSPPMV